jgi:hypothetical protein
VIFSRSGSRAMGLDVRGRFSLPRPLTAIRFEGQGDGQEGRRLAHRRDHERAARDDRPARSHDRPSPSARSPTAAIGKATRPCASSSIMRFSSRTTARAERGPRRKHDHGVHRRVVVGAEMPRPGPDEPGCDAPGLVHDLRTGVDRVPLAPASARQAKARVAPAGRAVASEAAHLDRDGHAPVRPPAPLEEKTARGRDRFAPAGPAKAREAKHDRRPRVHVAGHGAADGQQQGVRGDEATRGAHGERLGHPADDRRRGGRARRGAGREPGREPCESDRRSERSTPDRHQARQPTGPWVPAVALGDCSGCPPPPASPRPLDRPLPGGSCPRARRRGDGGAPDGPRSSGRATPTHPPLPLRADQARRREADGALEHGLIERRYGHALPDELALGRGRWSGPSSTPPTLPPVRPRRSAPREARSRPVGGTARETVRARPRSRPNCRRSRGGDRGRIPSRARPRASPTSAADRAHGEERGQASQ